MPGQGYQIAEVFAWIADHGETGEALFACRIGGAGLMTAAVTQEETAHSIAQFVRLALLTDQDVQRVRLVRFTAADVIDTIERPA